MYISKIQNCQGLLFVYGLLYGLNYVVTKYQGCVPTAF
jgi:hypothetical protein